MKTISKILLTVALLIGSIHVSAQYTSTHGTRKSTPNTTYKETVRWRINLGMNASTMRGEGVNYIEQIGGDKKKFFRYQFGSCYGMEDGRQLVSATGILLHAQRMERRLYRDKCISRWK